MFQEGTLNKIDDHCFFKYDVRNDADNLQYLLRVFQRIVYWNVVL